MRCECFTSTGKQCSREAKAGSKYCWQHQKCSNTPGTKAPASTQIHLTQKKSTNEKIHTIAINSNNTGQFIINPIDHLALWIDKNGKLVWKYKHINPKKQLSLDTIIYPIIEGKQSFKDQLIIDYGRDYSVTIKLDKSMTLKNFLLKIEYILGEHESWGLGKKLQLGDAMGFNKKPHPKEFYGTFITDMVPIGPQHYRLITSKLERSD